MPFRDGSVDAVLSLGVVEHVEAGPLDSLRELHRILKPGGLLVLDVPYNNLFRRLVANPLQSFMTWRRRRAQWKLAFSEYRFDRREVRRFLEASGFEPLTAGPNEMLPPKNMGLWADYHNIVFDPFRPPRPEELFVLPGMLGRVAGGLVRLAPWAVCSEIVFVARAR
jgi:SAM-dependent methyltransferase